MNVRLAQHFFSAGDFTGFGLGLVAALIWPWTKYRHVLWIVAAVMLFLGFWVRAHPPRESKVATESKLLP